jgi:translation initiation factor 1
MAKPKDNWKDRLGVVFSTDPDFHFEAGNDSDAETLPPQQQKLRVMVDRKQRKGKEVTLVTGFIGSQTDLEALGRQLKQQCGVGGTVKDGEILVQGNHRQRVYDLLIKTGYSQTKMAGG